MRRSLSSPDIDTMGQYEQHVFVCTTGKTCVTQDSAGVFQCLRDGVKEAGLQGRVRINASGCMSQCGHGVMVVVYPQDVWYAGVDAAGAKRILDEHLVAGAPVEALRYVAPPGDNKVPKE
ncbi:MAG: (2Fe-2S) ferredoxin domain-containing protein [Gemmatimonadales bacterium]|nr:(2Fe-2S) ferredoxin domain-containing protein [Gemmatimonadota bacterium]MCL4213269.1 (2Fe-2S) ferredoxin domain-containing protein [Gemmatimonadales bacterium]